MYHFDVVVKDNATPAASDRHTVTITVREVDAAPSLDAIADQSVAEGSALSFQAVAHDGDLPAKTLTFSLSGAPAGASIDTHSGVFNWTPSEQQGPASYNFSVIVTDDAAQPLTASQLVHVTVNEVNTPPELAFIGDRTVDQGSTLTFTATASDADLPANLLAFSLRNAPDGSSISASAGVFNWTPSASQAGSYMFSIE